MSRFIYLLYGIAVLVGSTWTNLSYVTENSTTPSNWGSQSGGRYGGSTGSGGSSSTGHK
jgi:hypothetical protein